jgi:transposase
VREATASVGQNSEQRIAELEARVSALTQELDAAHRARESLKRAYTNALEQLQLLRRRLFVAKAERFETPEEQMSFEALQGEVQRLENALDSSGSSSDTEEPPGRRGRREPSGPSKPKGRRDLAKSSAPEIRVEVLDPELEGKAERIGFKDTWLLGYERGGLRRIRVAVATYKLPESEGRTTDSERIVDAPRPKHLLKRSLLAPALIAHILVAKYMMGVPFYRLEQLMRLQGESLDRGTMCRISEDVGASLGAIVLAQRDHAMATAFCLATDATGVSIQPTPLPDKRRQPCRKGHFFVVLADRDYVFFEYQPKHTSAAVCEMFRGFHGYIQADAHAVYDALFRGPPQEELFEDPTGPPPKEVGCLSHCRRNFWDAAVCKHADGIDGLRRIDAIFAADARLKGLPPSKKKLKRQELVRPLVEAFFTWVEERYARVKERGLVAKALGYAFRQQEPLKRFLEDGRLRIDNNSAERGVRPIATGRKAWLFMGSDDHAEAAANVFSLVATCKLHGLDPEAYFCDVIRVMPYWPRDRYLELSPRFWAETRSRLDPAELEKPIGHITVPPPLPPQEQAASD